MKPLNQEIMHKPIPQQKAPKLEFPLLSGNEWNLAKQTPENFTLIVFYRGMHCPICEKYLKQLQELLPDLHEKGVNVIAVSMDNEKRARLSRKKWNIENLNLGYGLSEEMAQNWGLYLSSAIKDGEPAKFSEPGLFLIDNENVVYYTAINSNPWGRPHLPSFVKGLQYIIKSGYPARGEIVY